MQLFGGGELVIERNQNAAAEENRVGRNQPFRLIRHDDRGARAVLETRILQRARERQRDFLELAVGEADILAVAVRFDQADFVGPAIERRAQRFAEAIVFVGDRASKARLDALGERAEIADALKFVVGQLDAEMLLDAREQVERLQAVDAELLEEIVVRRSAARAAP